MKFPWFVRFGIFYFPKSIIGWLVTIIALIFAVYRFIEIDSISHSASDTLRPFIINLIFIFIVYTLIAIFSSLNSKKAG